MSYILDALKKSEQERGHGSIPDVQTIHSSSLNYRRDRKAWWPYILILAVALNLAAIVYFNVNRTDKAPAPDMNTQAATADETPALTKPATQKSNDATAGKQAITEPPPVPSANIPETLPAGTKKTAATPPQIKAESTPAKTPQKPLATTKEPAIKAETRGENRGDIIDYNELPESFREQLPVINVTAHVYSSNPQQRSIVINNNFMEEGEYVLDGLVLYEITGNGAIFSYHGTLFHYNVVSGWQ